MFSPTKSLLLRPMPVLNGLRIHQQLPLNSRESKQLLNLLTTSFRSHLETESSELKPELGQKSDREAAHNEGSKNRRRSISESWHSPTERHMNSILTNPLFNHLFNNEKKRLTRDPLEVFDGTVARGLMDIPTAKAILYAKKREIVQSSVPSIREGMKQSGAGLNVLKWLISSGATNDLEFLKDEAFAGILMQYMVAEGLQEAAWTWIKKSLEKTATLSSIEPSHFQQVRREIVSPLVLLVKAEASGPVALDNAYLCLSRAAGYLNGLPALTMRHILGPPGRFLAHQSLTSDFSSRPPPGTSSFESFLGLVPVFARNTASYFAHLTLVHPEKPSADLALSFLRNVEAINQENARELKAPIVGATRLRDQVNLGLDCAKFLLENDRYDEAAWVMDMLRENFPEQIGVQEGRRQLDKAKAEASSMELLEELSLA